MSLGLILLGGLIYQGTEMSKTAKEQERAQGEAIAKAQTRQEEAFEAGEAAQAQAAKGVPTTPEGIAALQETEKGKQRRRRGTILTSPRGILTAPKTSFKTLLGD